MQFAASRRELMAVLRDIQSVRNQCPRIKTILSPQCCPRMRPGWAPGWQRCVRKQEMYKNSVGYYCFSLRSQTRLAVNHHPTLACVPHRETGYSSKYRRHRQSSRGSGSRQLFHLRSASIQGHAGRFPLAFRPGSQSITKRFVTSAVGRALQKKTACYTCCSERTTPIPRQR